MWVMPSSSSSLASAPCCIIWLNAICRVAGSVWFYALCYIICILCHCCVTNYHKLSGVNETHLLAHRSLLRASQGWNPGAGQLHPHRGLGLLFWGHFSLLADFSSYACRTEVPVALVAGGRGTFSAFRDHPHSLPRGPLYLQGQQGRISLVPNPSQASDLPLPLTSVPRFKGNHKVRSTEIIYLS